MITMVMEDTRMTVTLWKTSMGESMVATVGKSVQPPSSEQEGRKEESSQGGGGGGGMSHSGGGGGGWAMVVTR